MAASIAGGGTMIEKNCDLWLEPAGYRCILTNAAVLNGEAVPDMQRRANASAGAKEARRYIEQGKAAIAARQDVGGVR